MTPEIQRLDVAAQLQSKLAERARNDVDIATLKHQAQLFVQPTAQLQPTSAPERSSSGGYLLLVVVLTLFIAGLLAQNEQYFRHW